MSETLPLEHPSVQRYLRDVEMRLRPLPASRREDLLADLRDHIEQSLADADVERYGRRDDAVAYVLAGLGDPALVAQAALETADVAPERPPSWLVPATVSGLLVGGLLVPVVGWLVGVVLLWTARVWSWRDKLLGTLVLPGGLLPAVYLWFDHPIRAEQCEMQPSPLGGPAAGVCWDTTTTATTALTILLVALLSAAPVAVAVHLTRRAYGRG